MFEHRLPAPPLPTFVAWGIALAAASSPAMANDGSVWDLRRVTPGLHEHPFALQHRATLELDVVGAGSADLDQLHAYGWILNLDTGKVAWSLNTDSAQPLTERDTWGFVGRVEFEAGNYVAYFNAIGRHVPHEGALSVIEFPLALLHASVGKWKPWDAYGRSRDWRFRIAADDRAVDALATRIETHESDDLFIDFAPLQSNTFESVTFRVDQPVQIELRGNFEFDPQSEDYVDRAWLIDAGSGATIWTPELDDAEPAGGAVKNHAFVRAIDLKPGDYVISALTDDSHAYDDWNEAAPWNPTAWGVELKVVEGDPESLSMIDDPRRARQIASIDRVGSSSLVRTGFRILRPVDARVVGLAEAGKQRRSPLVDFGWIERVPERTIVWTMQGKRGEPAGGSDRNRAISDDVTLDPGDYLLTYVTDAGHAFDDWSFSPPREPNRWGIGLFARDTDFDPGSVEEVPVADIDPAFLSLAPTGNRADRSRVMTLPRAYDIRVIVIGEAVREVLYDYGWIEDADTGQKLWKMNYGKTAPAGGAKKNRMVDEVVRLQAGRYRVRYKSDDSHAFGDWNEDPPDRPDLYGITLYHVGE